MIKSSNSLDFLTFELNVSLTLLVMVIVCAKPFKRVLMVYKLWSRYDNIDFLTFEQSGLDLEGSDQIVALYTLPHNGDYFCQVILKKLWSRHKM